MCELAGAVLMCCNKGRKDPMVNLYAKSHKKILVRFNPIKRLCQHSVSIRLNQDRWNRFETAVSSRDSPCYFTRNR